MTHSYTDTPTRAARGALIDLGLRPAAADAILDAWPGAVGLSSATANHIAAAVKSRTGRTLARSQAGRVVAALRLASVGTACRDAYRPQLRTPADVGAYCRAEYGARDRETFVAVWLDARQRVIGVDEIAVGTLSQVDVHPREVYRPGIRVGAHALICAHNHPSGDAEPSDADLALTHRLANVGTLVGIPLLDHVVVSHSDAVSLASLGLLA